MDLLLDVHGVALPSQLGPETGSLWLLWEKGVGGGIIPESSEETVDRSGLCDHMGGRLRTRPCLQDVLSLLSGLLRPALWAPPLHFRTSHSPWSNDTRSGHCAFPSLCLCPVLPTPNPQQNLTHLQGPAQMPFPLCSSPGSLAMDRRAE